ncbi:hypothetical protein ACS5NO_13725 [Larkinella sp. GY13]|uniref:hypothetical protein n=1 Tax=Larkinella sp. GY13 TaxID=3453720 RepID=UPI003EEEB8B0
MSDFILSLLKFLGLEEIGSKLPLWSRLVLFIVLVLIGFSVYQYLTKPQHIYVAINLHGKTLTDNPVIGGKLKIRNEQENFLQTRSINTMGKVIFDEIPQEMRNKGIKLGLTSTKYKLKYPDEVYSLDSLIDVEIESNEKKRTANDKKSANPDPKKTHKTVTEQQVECPTKSPKGFPVSTTPNASQRVGHKWVNAHYEKINGECVWIEGTYVPSPDTIQQPTYIPPTNQRSRSGSSPTYVPPVRQ